MTQTQSLSGWLQDISAMASELLDAILDGEVYDNQDHLVTHNLKNLYADLEQYKEIYAIPRDSERDPGPSQAQRL